jgi:hypothetical protein
VAIRRINETVLAGEYTSLRELAAATGRRPEPWRVAVLLGGEEPSRHERGQLDRVVRAGAACGVHLVVRGISLPEHPDVRRVVLEPDAARIGVPVGLPVRLDPPPPATLVTETCRQVAATVNAGPPPAPFTDLLPAGADVEGGLVDRVDRPIGESPTGRQVQLTLGDYPPHALIGGPSGTGKTNLIFAWIGALAARYSPSELEFYLLDFKEGVSFARFAQGRRDPSWLPHMRLVGINVNTDREFGLALLRFLAEELRRRADAAKKHEVTKLAELRAVDPTGHWPRIVAVVDEFQMLLAGRDVVARESADLLEDLIGGAVPRASTWCGLAGRPGHRGALGPAAWSPSSPCASRCPRRCGSWPSGTTRPSRCPGTTRWSTPSPGWPRGTRWPGSRRPATGTPGAGCSTGCGGCGHRTPRRPGSSTATRFPGWPTRRTTAR